MTKQTMEAEVSKDHKQVMKSFGSLYPTAEALAMGIGRQRKRILDGMKGDAMQKLAPACKHIAEWGTYQIVIDLRANPLLLIRDSSPPHTGHIALQCSSAEDALIRAGMWLDQHGCAALVDGRRRNISNFLFFVPDGVL